MLKDKWPGAYDAVEAFTLDSNEMGNLVALSILMVIQLKLLLLNGWQIIKIDGAIG